jgi:multicomponent Na+:H+ antiporter subunit C
MIYNIPFIVSFILIILGIYSLLFKKNLIKIICGFVLIQSGIILLIASLGYVNNSSVNSIPQFLVLITIILGTIIISLMLMITIQIYQNCYALDINKLDEEVKK